MTSLEVDESIPGLLYENGYNYFNAEDTLLLFGMSPGNSFFSREKIKEYITYLSYKPQRTLIVVPETPTEHTYKALGISNTRKIAHKKTRELMAKAREAVESLPTTDPRKFIFLDWVREVDTDPSYKSHVHSLYGLFDKGGKIHSETVGAADKVLQLRGFKPQSDAHYEASVNEAARYLIDELALLSAMHDRFKKNICTIYHEPFGAFASYAAGDYDGEPKDWLGEVVLK